MTGPETERTEVLLRGVSDVAGPLLPSLLLIDIDDDDVFGVALIIKFIFVVETFRR